MLEQQLVEIRGTYSLTSASVFVICYWFHFFTIVFDVERGSVAES
jgi:hypothetical protein